MKVTTVRFGADLWRLLQAEAEVAGVSVSQYVRDAALARASAAAAVRGDDPLVLLAGALSSDLAGDAAGSRPEAARRAAVDTRAEAQATRAEAEQARRHAQATRRGAREAARPDAGL